MTNGHVFFAGVGCRGIIPKGEQAEESVEPSPQRQHQPFATDARAILL